MLVALNVVGLNTIDDLYEALGGIAAGSTVTAKLVRGVEALELDVEFPG